MSTQSKRIVRAYLLLFVLLAALSFLSLAVGQRARIGSRYSCGPGWKRGD